MRLRSIQHRAHIARGHRRVGGDLRQENWAWVCGTIIASLWNPPWLVDLADVAARFQALTVRPSANEVRFAVRSLLCSSKSISSTFMPKRCLVVSERQWTYDLTLLYRGVPPWTVVIYTSDDVY